MPGQVFVVQGDTTRLTCDAWVVPTDAHLSVTQKWLISATKPTGVDPAVIPADLPDWGDHRRRVWPLPTEQGCPQPWLVNLGGVDGTPAAWYADGAHAYVQAAAKQAHARGPLNGRDRPLLAMHLVGTGEGGAADYKGRVLPALLERLQTELAALEVDVVLVARGAAHYSACQEARSQLIADPWPELDVGLQAHARALGEMARDGRLVLFAGAGISAGAGLPLWDELLRSLAKQLGLEDQADAISRLDSLDQARYLANRLSASSPVASGRTLGSLIAEMFRGDRYGLAHAHLAGLPVREAVTTNYDELLELAAGSMGDPADVAEFVALPYERLSGQRRWLLKMHGTVTEPNDIVLTRDDYLNYAARRGALAGIVQALLITRHMLFVGFSLRDDNFHRIAHDVRQAIRRPGQVADDPFGTVLLLEPDPFLDGLWSGDLRSVAVGPACTVGDDPETERRTASRRLEIFLDCIASHAADRTRHLLDPTFADLLDADEQEAAARLRDLERHAANHPQSEVWQAVAASLECFGRVTGRHGNAGGTLGTRVRRLR